MTGLDALRERLRPLPEGPCLMGLSGGADSVGLMHLLLPLREKNGFQLEAVHVNHGLRGAESDGDEAFARELCAREGVPFRSVRLELGGRRDENAAREARYKVFEETMRELGLRTLILAHQMDDQAETFLMRLLRGAGPEGLAGMRPEEKRGEYTLLRTMLETIRKITFFFRSVKDGVYPHLKRAASSLIAFPEVQRRIDNILDRYGEIKDTASDELYSIRKSIKDKESSVSRRINAILKKAQQDGIVDSDAAVSVRDGKMLIPVSSFCSTGISVSNKLYSKAVSSLV